MPKKKSERGQKRAPPGRTRGRPPGKRERPEAARPPGKPRARVGSGAEHPAGANGGEAQPRQHPPSPARPTGEARFPIVAIGASAGGLEALERFLGAVPPKSGAAYVIVQHLDPADKGGMIPILQRATSMPVEQARDGVRVEPDRVYMIAPNRDMSILHGELHLMTRVRTGAVALPVDYFFRSLAADRQERAAAVILSGMGTDGTLGLRAIKEKGGPTFVQSLSSAKFDGMPRSAIDSGMADVVASAEELPARILAFHRHATQAPAPDDDLDDRQRGALAKVFILLRSQTGNDFSVYKRSTVIRRIERRMGLHQIERLPSYVRFLRENPKEVDQLFRELLIGVTSFFRDPDAWDHLRSKVLPPLVAARAGGPPIRAWVPGCSTGEEAYSLAMVLREAAEARGPAFQIFATDIDADAIERARVGVYPANIVADVSPERLRRFFVQDERGYRVGKEVREQVVFAPQNVVMDPPFTKLDLLSCRNLLIYLSPEVQRKLVPLFHYALNPGGVLFLGSAETVGPFGSLFRPLDGKTRIYERLDHAAKAPPEFFSRHPAPPQLPGAEPGAEGPSPAPSSLPNLQPLAERTILQQFAPAAVLADEKGEILYFSGKTGKYLEPVAGRANLNVVAMAREGLRYPLSSALARAAKEGGPVTVHGVRVGNGGTETVDVTIQRLAHPRELRGALVIVFHEVAAGPERPPPARSRASPRHAELEAELARAQEELQSTREEMQTSQEELKSMNEELQSTNEELQSTNEELTTSKEEMQSMNEELQTVNQELHAKVDELSRSNNDMKNLFNSTELATLFLDGDLKVRRFTSQTSKLYKLIPADAGRPFTDIATELDYPELAEDAREVLRTLAFREAEVSTRGGRWFNVRILPYRTADNVIDGVVITFTDVTATKRLEAQLRERASDLRRLTEALPVLPWSCRPDGACDLVGRQWVEYTGLPESQHLGWGWLDDVHPDDRDRVRDAWRASVSAETPLEVELRLRAGDGTYRWFKCRSAPIRDEHGSVTRWYGTHTDVDDLKRGAGGQESAR